jgi:long-chain fatty acid transport protein
VSCSFTFGEANYNSLPCCSKTNHERSTRLSVFYTSPINDKWSAGVGLFTTYGLRSDYSDDFEALHFADTAEVRSITLNPAVSYKLNDNLMLGLGLNATFADAEISSAISNSLSPILSGALQTQVPANTSIFKLEGEDWGFGWNVGALWQPTDATNIALSYRAETELTLSGDVSSQITAELNQPGSLDLNLAAITELAVNQRLDSQWSVQASLTFTDWSTFEKLEANLNDGSDFLIKQENFDDSLRASVGVTYILSDELTLRAGYAYDDGVVTVENRSLSIPDTDRHWVSGGFTYSFNDDMSIDGAYVYINGREADIDKTRALNEQGTLTSTFVGSQSATAHIFSVQFNSRF